MIRQLLLSLSALAALAGASTAASAQPLVRIDVVDRETGQWLPEHAHRRDAWIAGTPGHRYGVRLTNTTSERVLVVLSVDGVNAVTGETAHPSQTGYVLAPWQSTEITGWRKSYDDVAQFVFTSLGDSYAARTGRPDNVGTIGIAAFRERRHVRPSPLPRIARSEGAGSANAPQSASAPAAESIADGLHDRSLARQRIGTGHGQQEWSPVGQTSFVRAGARPDQVTQLRYDSPHALSARGILPRPNRHWSHAPSSPQAFPGSFVPDPPRGGW